MQKKNKRAVSALVATVLLILITVAAVGIIWGAIMPMLNKATQLGQACTSARLNIDTTRGYTCYDANKKQASIMISRGAEDFELAGMQIGLASEGEIKSYTLKEDINLLTNGDIELWSAGTSEVPDGWTGYTSETNREGTIIKLGTYSAKLTITGAVGGSAYLMQDIHTEKGIAYWKGRTVTVGSWVWSATADKSYTAIYHYGTGGGATSSYHTGDSTWQFLTVTVTIPNDATSVGIFLYGTTIGTIVYFDGAIAVEGPNAEIWEETKVYAELPGSNEAKTYKLTTGELVDIKEASVAPIVRVGTTEKVCDVSSKVQVPKCV